MIPYAQRRHGSEQRGVASVPRGLQRFDAQQQSRLDKQRMIEAARLRLESTQEDKDGLGNKNLPVYKHKKEIIDLVENYKAVILGGPTGSGKSTQVPQYLLEEGYRTYMLVPRRIIADGLYDRLIEELSEHYGKEEAERIVGIAHGERSEHSEESRIMVMTPNTFARMEAGIRAQYGQERVAIVSDEIHEANLYTEIATGIAAQAVDEHETWRLIAASATHNAASLQAVFGNINGGFVPAIEIEGRPFEVELQEASAESPMEVYARVGSDHAKSMIFTSGKKEIDHIIDETIKTLETYEKGSSQNVVFRKLHAELSDVELLHINDSIPEDKRLVIVSSPAGMSGITIPGVTLVVTDGTINRAELDDNNVSGLTRKYLSKAEIIQQIGRAGRDVAGGVGIVAAPTAVMEDRLRAYGREVDVEQMPYLSFSARDEFGPPEISSSNLLGVTLTIASLDRKFADINSYLPHQQAPSVISNAGTSLARIGALDDDDCITDIGRKMSDLPIRPELSRGVIEAVMQGRPLQQLARIAIIAAAIDAGGVQEFSNKKSRSRRWESLLRPTTQDDVIAQLDLVTADLSVGNRYAGFLDAHDLSYKRMERTQKVARKILKTLGIHLENLVLTPSIPDEEQELRRDLTAGMIDEVHEQSKIIDRHQHYQKIDGTDETQRYISDRSVMPASQHAYVAGFARWFTRGRDLKLHQVVELAFPVDPADIGVYATQNQLLERSSERPLYDGNRVVEQYQPMFGSIPVGDPKISDRRDQIPKQSQKIIAHHALERPGYAQNALREIADEIEQYKTRLPKGWLEHYLRPDAPALVTKDTILSLVKQLASEFRSLHEIDNGIRQYIFRNNVGIERYFTAETRELLQAYTPNEITVDGIPLPLNYDQITGDVYVTGARQDVRNLVAGRDLRLPDGREVLVQVSHSELGKVRISAVEL